LERQRLAGWYCFEGIFSGREGGAVLMLLEVRALTRRYTRAGGAGSEESLTVDALRGASFSVGRGEFVSIMGPSGSGKSTLVHLLGGLDRPTSGSIEIDGEPIQSFNDNELSAFRRRRL